MLVTDLPTEIQSRIFAELYWEERELVIQAEIRVLAAHLAGPPLNLPFFYEHDTQWIEHGNLRAAGCLFPNTTASVCRLWQGIMSGTSRFWSRFMLDLDDPACLPLDVFSWSGSRVLDVVIKSRPQGTSEDAKEHENSRVLNAFKALAPHIPTCKSIILDVKYASSLPPPAPFFVHDNRHLEILKLEYQINDMVLPMYLDTHPTVALAQKFNNLQNLWLHGAMFMEVSRTDRTWLEQKSRANTFTTLTLSHLECSAGGETPYTVADLIEYLSMPTTLSALIFKHIRFVGHHGPRNILDNVVFEAGGSLTFEDVDPGFIYEFMPSSTGSFLDSVTFKNCRIPHVPELQALHLDLTDIPDSRSLKNILKHHNGTYITFTSCPGFNDRLLNRLATHLYVPGLRNLHIYKCDQFTVAGLRAFLKARKDGTPSFSHSSESLIFEEEVGAISDLGVGSSGLRLTDGDKTWFKEYFGDHGYISWYEHGLSQHDHSFVHP